MSFEQIANFKIANVSINDIFSAILLLVLCLLVMKLFMQPGGPAASPAGGGDAAQFYPIGGEICPFIYHHPHCGG